MREQSGHMKKTNKGKCENTQQLELPYTVNVRINFGHFLWKHSQFKLKLCTHEKNTYICSLKYSDQRYS